MMLEGLNLESLLNGSDVTVEQDIEKELVQPVQESAVITQKESKDSLTVENKVEESTSTEVNESKINKNVMLTKDSKYLNNFEYKLDVVGDDIRLIKENKDGTIKTLERRNRYFYISPDVIETLGYDIQQFTYISGGQFIFVGVQNNIKVVVQDSISGYYPGTVTIIKEDVISVNKIKHTEKFVNFILSLLK